MLRYYDLPDLAAEIAPRKVVIGNARSATGQVLDRANVAASFASENVEIVRRREASGYVETYFPGMQ